jgi:hypothetical protein
MKRVEDHWLQTRWRPITAVVYLVICVFDFMVFPVLWSFFLHFVEAADKTIAWDPLTLKGAGLFHLAFGAILGVSAFTRGQEKIHRIDNSGRQYTRETHYDRYEDEYPEERLPEDRPRFSPPR